MNILTNTFIILSLALPFTSNTEYIENIPPEPPVIQAKLTVVERKPTTPTQIPQPTPEQLALIEKYASIYNVDTQIMLDVIRCESGFDEDIQSRHIYKTGGREKSFGLVQIHLPHHPTVTYQQAIDPEFAINFLAEKLSQNQGHLWTCYRQLASR